MKERYKKIKLNHHLLKPIGFRSGGSFFRVISYLIAGSIRPEDQVGIRKRGKRLTLSQDFFTPPAEAGGNSIII